jgi:exopolysaccharide biosynthesis polyprenyl glycosylphosphotransferase
MSNLAEFRAETRSRDWSPPDGPPATRMSGLAPAPVAESVVKRIIDIAFALIGVILFLPLLCVVALAIRAESPGPALFRQKRTGLNGRVFTVFKFRTMTVTEDGGDIRQASRGDDRVTALGAILRKLSIDELPQMLNVLRGEMSLIGPRPHAVVHDQTWSEVVPNYARRFRARPGLTGWAAVCGHRGEIMDLQSIVDRVAADNDYIDNWSIGLDLKILWRTVPLIFTDANAY